MKSYPFGERLTDLTTLGVAVATLLKESKSGTLSMPAIGKDSTNGFLKWLQDVLLAAFTSQDTATLDFVVAIMRSEGDKELVRAFILRLKKLDEADKGKRMPSLAANIFFKKNKAETVKELNQPPAQTTKGKGAKNGAEPATVTIKETTRSPLEDTPDDVRVKYLEDIAKRIRKKMKGPTSYVGFTGSPVTNGLSREEAIDEVIGEMEASGFISTESFEKRFREVIDALEKTNVEFHRAIIDARLTLTTEEYDAVEQKVNEAAKNAFPKVKESDTCSDDGPDSEVCRKKRYFEEELIRCLDSEMRVKTGRNLPEEERKRRRQQKTKELSAVPKKQKVLLWIVAGITVVMFVGVSIFSLCNR